MFGELLLHFGIKEFATFVTETIIFAMTPGIDTVFVLNPKVALFFLAFFSQFIVATQVDNAAAYLLLGVVYAMISAVWLVALAMLAGTVLSKLLTSQKAKRYMDIGSGAVFVLMGAKVAVSD